MFFPHISYVDIDILSVSLCTFSLPQATDETLLDRLKQQHQDDPFFLPSSNTEQSFVIQHFAGRVKYHIKVEFIFLHCTCLFYKENHHITFETQYFQTFSWTTDT